MGQIWNRIYAKETHREEHWSEGHIHEFSDVIDNLVEPLTELITTHQCHCEHEANRGGQDGVCCEDDPHSDLWLVAVGVYVRLRRQVNQLLFLQDLLHDEGVRDDDQQAGCCDQL